MTVKSERAVGGVAQGALAWWLRHQSAGPRALVVLPSEEAVLDLADDLRALDRVPRDWRLPVQRPVHAYPADDEARRQVSLTSWLGAAGGFLVTSLEGLSLPCDDPALLRERTFDLRPGLTVKRPEFEEMLAIGAYSRTERIEQVGEYAIRGDVIDVWPPQEDAPIRIVWNLDTIEAIRVIDLYSQRSQTYRTEATLHPVMAGSAATLASVIPTDAAVYGFESAAESDLLPGSAIAVRAGTDAPVNEGYAPSPQFGGRIPALKDQLVRWHEDDWRVLVFCHNQGERDRLDELLEDPEYAPRGERAPWCPPMVIGELEHGFLHPGLRIAVLANSEIFGRYRKRVRLPKFEGGETLGSPVDLRNGDFVVHERHGIGRYIGLKPLKVGGITSEFLSMEYKGGDKLYVPIFELQQVQKYMGAEGRRPSLSSLDTPAWERVKAKVKEDVAKLAAELLGQAARRSVRPGYAFPSGGRMEQEFGQSFLYDLTPDQRRTWEEVSADMEGPRAMDRLICGDVGYGKTEIALRAAFKAALAGKQVCFLCPTTILAEQHFRNFTERLADYPVTAVLLSRFQSKAEQKETLARVAKGTADIVVGTHRLLSADVAFRDLGLLIIDEEHRFGVRQKNKLFELRTTVDVLSLTATPIPRTLGASLSGIKSLSVIESPPEGRLPIHTHVGVFDEDLMARAVQEELDRGGQVFYVHNRVKTLQSRMDWLKAMMPNIRIAMVHGQMKEDGLERSMHDFLHNKVDLLLATTIIESGLDIPSVNTLIVEEAEEMGLAQLYQLRGRVGRSRRRAFCYLFYSAVGMTTDARRRLDALKEFTSLGSGLRLAMRDMEIRGAGNLLGPQQHGNMAAVGLETFSRLLQEEIQRVKGEEVVEDASGPTMELSLSSYIPDDYLPSESERVQMYKRILGAKEEELAKLKEELVDRCGPLPAPAKTLFDAAALRLLLRACGVSEVHQEPESALLYFKPTAALSDAAFERIMAEQGKALELIPGPPTGVRVTLQPDEAVLDALGRFLRTVVRGES